MCTAPSFLSDRRGSTAVEFGMIAGMLIMTIVYILIVGLILYFGHALDTAAGKAARQVMTGSVQTTGMSQSDFQTAVCGYLPAGFNCKDVIVNLYTVDQGVKPAGFYKFVKGDLSGLVVPDLSSGAGQFSPGTQGSFEYLQIIYPVTSLPPGLASVLGGGATYKGSPAYLVMATAVFRNELY